MPASPEQIAFFQKLEGMNPEERKQVLQGMGEEKVGKMLPLLKEWRASNPKQEASVSRPVNEYYELGKPDPSFPVRESGVAPGPQSEEMDFLSTIQAARMRNSGMLQALGAGEEGFGDLAKEALLYGGRRMQDPAYLMNLPARVGRATARAMGVEAPPLLDAVGVLGARASQGYDPFIGGDVGDQAFDLPGGYRGEHALSQLPGGTATSAALQTVAMLAPNVPEMLVGGGAIKQGAQQGAKAVGKAVLSGAVKSGANAAWQGAAGASKGTRLETAAFAGGIGAAAGGGIGGVSAFADNLRVKKVPQPTVATPEQILAKIADQRRQVEVEGKTALAPEVADTVPSPSHPGTVAAGTVAQRRGRGVAKAGAAADNLFPATVVVSKNAEGVTVAKWDGVELPVETADQIDDVRGMLKFRGVESITADPAINRQDAVLAVGELMRPVLPEKTGLLDEDWRAQNLATGKEAKLVPSIGVDQSGRPVPGLEQSGEQPKITPATPERAAIRDSQDTSALTPPKKVEEGTVPGKRKLFAKEDVTRLGGVEDAMKRGQPIGGGAGVDDADMPTIIDLRKNDSPAVAQRSSSPGVDEKNIRAPDEPPFIMDAAVVDADNVGKFMQAAAKANEPGLVDKFMDGMLHDIHRGPRELRERLQQLLGARALNRADELIRPFRKRLPGKDVVHKASYAMKKFQQGELSLDDLKATLPEQYRADFADFAKQFVGEIEQNSKYFESRGLGRAIEPMTEERLAPYLGRFYYTFMLPQGEWAKIVANAPPGTSPHRARLDMEAYLYEDAAKHGELLDEAQVGQELMSILRAENPMEFFRSRANSSTEAGRSKAFDRLRKRKNLPEVFRRFLGEEENGVVAMAYTLAHQRQLKAQIEAWDSLAADVAGGVMKPVLSTAPVPGWIKVPDKPTFGAAAGQFVHPSFRSALEMPKAYNHGLGIMHKVVGNLKYAQVVGGGPSAYVNNFMRNLWGSVLSGLFDPLRPDKSAGSMYEAAKQLIKYYDNPKGDSIVLEARKFGALSAPFGRTEIAEDAYRRDLVKHVYGKMKPEGSIDSVYNLALGAISKFKDKSTALYDAIDQTFKLATYIKLKNEGMAKGLTPDDASRFAARRINDSYANFEHIGSAVDKARRVPVVFNTYLSGHAEELRILGLLPRRMAEEPLFLVNQMVGAAAYMAAFYTLNKYARAWAGISQGEIDTIESELTQREQTYRPLRFYLPWRDSNGAPIAIDPSIWFMPLQLLQGHPQDNGAIKLASNVVLNSFGDLPAEKLREMLLEKTGVLRPIQRDPHQIQSEAAVGKGIQELWRAGFLGPTFFRKIPEQLHRAGAVDMRSRGRFDEQLTPGVAAAQLAFPVTTPHKAGGPNRTKQALEFARDELYGIAGNQQSIRQVAGSTRSAGDKKALIKKEAEAIKQQAKEFREKRGKKMFK